MPGGRKKKKEVWLPDYFPTEEEQAAYMYCMNNEYIISPIGLKDDKSHYHIGIASAWEPRDVKLSPETYTAKEVWPKMYEFCLYYYNKRKISGDENVT